MSPNQTTILNQVMRFARHPGPCHIHPFIHSFICSFVLSIKIHLTWNKIVINEKPSINPSIVRLTRRRAGPRFTFAPSVGWNSFWVLLLLKDGNPNWEREWVSWSAGWMVRSWKTVPIRRWIVHAQKIKLLSFLSCTKLAARTMRKEKQALSPLGEAESWVGLEAKLENLSGQPQFEPLAKQAPKQSAYSIE